MKTYSYSRIGAYENCPFQFKLRYIDRIKPDTEGIEAFMGSRVHESLEKLYRDKMMAKDPQLDELIDFYDVNWEKKFHDGVLVIRKDYTSDNYKEIGRNCLEGYYRRYYPFEQAKTIALEMRIEVPLPDSEFKFIGFIDRVDQRENGTYEIHDYKTSSTLPYQSEIDQDKQLALYQLGIEPLWNDISDVDLVWHYLKFDKEFRSKRNRITLEMLKEEIVKKIYEIETAESFEPKESALCNWCGYQDLCPSKKHAFKVADLPPDAFIEEDGVRLVNRFIELKNQKKKLEEEESRLKDAIYRYALREGVDVINGSEYRLRIKISKKPEYPSKSRDEERYNELVNLLKSSGIWEEVSVFNSNKLVKLLDTKQIDDTVANSIKTFEEIVEYRRIYPSRLKDDES
ncbi:MAG: exonuclease [Candidatus Syntrophoarchaeum caldarius]|uniref:Exonuclease n=1 Tax=Candidatus Syntropharchaeum caldarium TaxID=1838285 RepID=A0A1F2P7T8_9EURY|nr:MAG: exonuclease [Candidatus Syntrophoarchaeum caldarius]